MSRCKSFKQLHHSTFPDRYSIFLCSGINYATGSPPPGITHHWLYDLKNDPDETHTLASDPENLAILETLQSEIIQTFEQTHPKAGQIPEEWSVEEKLMAFGEPPEENADLNAK